METTQHFYRHFSFDAFKHFLSSEVVEEIRSKMASKCRDRCFGLEGFVWMGLFIAAYTGLPSLQQIFDLAGALPRTINSISLASVSAFCQYRASFSLKVMLYLWRYLLEQFKTKFNRADYTWRGFRLRALDGTSVNLPEKLYPYFGALGGWGPGPVQGFLMVLYSLAWRVPIALRIRPAVDEGRPHLILKHLLHHLKVGDLLLIDRGLYSLEIFSLLLKQGIHFVIPMRSNGRPQLVKCFKKNDRLYQIKASPYWKDNPLVPAYLTVRIISYQVPGFRPRRLVTSLLEPEQYPAEEIIKTYHQRWQIETFFREFKNTLQVTHWHAKTLPAFYSEILFQMLLVIVTRLVMAEAAVKAGIPPGDLSFGRSLAKVKRTLAIIPFLPVKEWIKIYVALVEQLKDYLIDLRPGRKFERDPRKRRLRSRIRYIIIWNIIWNILLKEKMHVA